MKNYSNLDEIIESIENAGHRPDDSISIYTANYLCYPDMMDGYLEYSGFLDQSYCLCKEDAANAFKPAAEEAVEIRVWSSEYETIMKLYEAEQLENEILAYSEVIDMIEPTYPSIAGAIIISWVWHQYPGYCRAFCGVRWAKEGETEWDLITGNENSTYEECHSILLSAEEIEGMEGTELLEAVNMELSATHWQWDMGYGPTEKDIINGLGIEIESID